MLLIKEVKKLKGGNATRHDQSFAKTTAAWLCRATSCRVRTVPVATRALVAWCLSQSTSVILCYAVTNTCSTALALASFTSVVAAVRNDYISEESLRRKKTEEKDEAKSYHVETKNEKEEKI